MRTAKAGGRYSQLRTHLHLYTNKLKESATTDMLFSHSLKVFPLAFILILSIQANPALAWQLAKNSDGIEVYTQDSSYPNLDMFRGETELSTTLNELLEHVKRVDLATTWLHDCIESRMIKSLHQDHYIVYQVTKAPWPVSDRDYVLSIEIERVNSKQAVINVTGLDRFDLVPEQKDRIRVSELMGIWTLTELDSKTVRISYETEANPTGNIPAWLANAFVVDQPFFTLKNLKQHFELN